MLTKKVNFPMTTSLVVTSPAYVVTIVIGLDRPDDHLEPALVGVQDVGMVEQDVDGVLVIIVDGLPVPATQHLVPLQVWLWPA